MGVSISDSKVSCVCAGLLYVLDTLVKIEVIKAMLYSEYSCIRKIYSTV